jgi:hypothetical protein
VVLERGPLSLVSSTEELLGRKSSALVWKAGNTAVGISHTDHVPPAANVTCLSTFHKLFSLDIECRRSCFISYALHKETACLRSIGVLLPNTQQSRSNRAPPANSKHMAHRLLFSLIRVEFILRLTLSQPVRLGIGLPFVAPDFILIPSLVTIAFLFFL